MTATHDQAKAPPRHLGTDGLRVFALLAVLAFHLWPEAVPGGFLGVNIFFVIAGYYGSRAGLHQKQPLSDGVVKRMTKLLGPLLFLLATLALFTAYLLPDVFLYVQDDASSALFGFNNLAQIWADRSYFERHGNFNPLTHLWALSLEMQFYLIFPFLFASLKQLAKLFRNKAARYREAFIGSLFLLLALGSGALMDLGYLPGGDPTPVYYGSLSRAFAFLLGAAGYLFTANAPKNGKPDVKKAWPQALLAWSLFLALLLPCFFFSFKSSMLFQGGMFLYSLLALLFIIFAGKAPAPGMGFFGHAVFRYLSARSYGIYLWQYSLMILQNAWLRFSNLGWFPRLVMHGLALLIFSELSYRIFEERGRIRAALRWVIAALLGLLLFFILLQPPQRSPKAPALNASLIEAEIAALKEEQERRLAALEERRQQERVAAIDPAHYAKEVGALRAEFEALKPPVPTDPLSNPFGYSEEDRAHLRATKLVMLGDSVLAMATQEIRKYVPMTYVDAEVSRQFGEAPSLLASLDASLKEGATIVIALGTNGDIPDVALQSLRAQAGTQPLFFVNLVVPGNWEQNNNRILKAFCDAHEQTWLIDWYATAKEHPEYFYQDATHPVPAGASVYDRMVLDHILAMKKDATSP